MCIRDRESPQDLTKVNAEVADAIDKYDFGGVILFAENVKETKQTLALTQDMQKAAIENKANNGKIPLLLAIDQEGGIVYRLGTGTALSLIHIFITKRFDYLFSSENTTA